MDQILPYVFLVVGVGIILFSFLTAYGLYQQLGTNQQQITTPTFTASNGTLNESISSAVSSLTTTMSNIIKADTNIGLEIVIMFLFVNIGYKLASIGINMDKANREVQAEPTRKKESSNAY